MELICCRRDRVSTITVITIINQFSAPWRMALQRYVQSQVYYSTCSLQSQPGVVGLSTTPGAAPSQLLCEVRGCAAAQSFHHIRPHAHPHQRAWGWMEIILVASRDEHLYHLKTVLQKMQEEPMIMFGWKSCNADVSFQEKPGIWSGYFFFSVMGQLGVFICLLT